MDTKSCIGILHPELATRHSAFPGVTSILTEEGSFAHIFGAVPRSLVPPPEEAHEYAWPGFTVKGQDVELPVAAVHTAALTDTKGDRSRRAENISGLGKAALVT
jgi:hypothetical protein